MAGTYEVGTAYVQILPSAKGISGSISKTLGGEAGAAGKLAGTQIANNLGATAGEKMKTIGKSMMKTGALMTAAGAGMIAFGKKMLDMYEEQEQAETKLAEIYKTRMGANAAAAKGTATLATHLQKVGVVADEVTLSGAQQLATFAKYPSTVNSLLPAMDNLLVQQHGLNATSQDATGVANLMGKAMMGNVGALQRVGITFTASQAKVLKYGNEQQRAAILAQVITDNVGNMNKAFAKTPAGKIAQAKNQLGEIGEQMGAILLPILVKVANYFSANILPVIQKAANFLQAHPIFTKIAVGVAAFLAIAGPIIAFLGSMIAAIGAIAGVEWAALVPILPIVAAIAAVIAIGVALYRNWDQIKANTVQCWTSIKTAVSTAVNAIKSVISTVFGIIKTIVRAAIDAVLLTIRVKIAAIKLVFRGIVAIVGVVRSVFSRVKSFMTAPITAAVGVIRSAINRIKSFFRITLRFDGIKLPHIDISWKSSGSIAKIAKKMGLPGVPDFGVRWYANGGIFNQATVAGIGEAGTEAAVPLDPFWKRFDMMADRIVTEVGNQMQGTSGQNGNINMCLEVDGKQFASVTAPYMGPAITKIETRDKRKGGRR